MCHVPCFQFYSVGKHYFHFVFEQKCSTVQWTHSKPQTLQLTIHNTKESNNLWPSFILLLAIFPFILFPGNFILPIIFLLGNMLLIIILLPILSLLGAYCSKRSNIFHLHDKFELNCHFHFHWALPKSPKNSNNSYFSDFECIFFAIRGCWHKMFIKLISLDLLRGFFRHQIWPV